MSNNPPPNIIWLQWDGDAETPEPCTDDPDDRDVTWCRERVFARDIQFERSDCITELKRELAEAAKDYLCLAELLDGNDATECRANLVKLQAELAAERALADRLADSLRQSNEGFGDRLPCEESCECAGRRIVKANDLALAAWKEARSGTR